jgi:hypothetical protein
MLDEARNWLRERQQPSAMTGNDFVAAVLAHGDIEHLPPEAFPACAGFGVSLHGGGQPAVDGWRAVLATKRLREPVPLPRPIVLRSPVQIAVGWGGQSPEGL